MLKFQVDKRISKSIFLRKWSKNAFDIINDAYETSVVIYKLDIHVSASSITISDVEKENSPPYPKNVVTNSEKEMTNLENTTPTTTP